MSSDGHSETPRLNAGSEKKRFYSPLATRRTWDRSSKPPASPFQRLSSSHQRSLRKTHETSPNPGASSQSDDLMGWIDSMKTRAKSILRTEEEEEKRFYRELKLERERYETHDNVHTEAFEKLKEFLDKENQPASYMDDENGIERAGIVSDAESHETQEPESRSESESLYEEEEEEEEEDEDYQVPQGGNTRDLTPYIQRIKDEDIEYDSEDNVILPEDAQYLELSSDGSEPSIPEYSANAFVDEDSEYRIDPQSTSAYTRTSNRYPNEPLVENNETGSEDEHQYSYEEEDADQEQGPIDLIAESAIEGDYAGDEFAGDGFADVDDYQSEHDFMSQDHHANYGHAYSGELNDDMQSMAAAALSQLGQGDQIEELSDDNHDYDGEEVVLQDGLSEMDEEIYAVDDNQDLGAVVMPVAENFFRDESSEAIEDESAAEGEDDTSQRRVSLLVETSTGQVVDLEDSPERPQAIQEENEIAASDIIEPEIEEPETHGPELEDLEIFEPEALEYQEEQYYDSDNEPFQDPSTSIFGNITQNDLDSSGDEEYIAKSTSNARILDDVEVGSPTPQEETNNEQLIKKEDISEHYPQVSDKVTGEIEPDINEANQDLECEEFDTAHSFVLFSNGTPMKPQTNTVTLEEASNLFVKSITPEPEVFKSFSLPEVVTDPRAKRRVEPGIAVHEISQQYATIPEPQDFSTAVAEGSTETMLATRRHETHVAPESHDEQSSVSKHVLHIARELRDVAVTELETVIDVEQAAEEFAQGIQGSQLQTMANESAVTAQPPAVGTGEPERHTRRPPSRGVLAAVRKFTGALLDSDSTFSDTRADSSSADFIEGHKMAAVDGFMLQDSSTDIVQPPYDIEGQLSEAINDTADGEFETALGESIPDITVDNNSYNSLQLLPSKEETVEEPADMLAESTIGDIETPKRPSFGRVLSQFFKPTVDPFSDSSVPSSPEAPEPDYEDQSLQGYDLLNLRGLSAVHLPKLDVYAPAQPSGLRYSVTAGQDTELDSTAGNTTIGESVGAVGDSISIVAESTDVAEMTGVPFDDDATIADVDLTALGSQAETQHDIVGAMESTAESAIDTLDAANSRILEDESPVVDSESTSLGQSTPLIGDEEETAAELTTKRSPMKKMVDYFKSWRSPEKRKREEDPDSIDNVSSSNSTGSVMTESEPVKKARLERLPASKNHIIVKTRSGLIIGANTVEEIKEAETEEEKEDREIEAIAHGQRKVTAELRDLASWADYIENHGDGHHHVEKRFDDPDQDVDNSRTKLPKGAGMEPDEIAAGPDLSSAEADADAPKLSRLPPDSVPAEKSSGATGIKSPLQTDIDEEETLESSKDEAANELSETLTEHVLLPLDEHVNDPLLLEEHVAGDATNRESTVEIHKAESIKATHLEVEDLLKVETAGPRTRHAIKLAVGEVPSLDRKLTEVKIPTEAKKPTEVKKAANAKSTKKPVGKGTKRAKTDTQDGKVAKSARTKRNKTK